MTISTKQKVYLHPIAIGDATREYLSWLNDPEVTKYLELRHVGEYTMEMLHKDIERYNADESVRWYAIHNMGGVHVGNIKIEINKNHQFGELGLLIGREYWGNGYATEAVKLMCDLAFAEYGLRRIVAGYYDDNEGSRRVFEKNGFETEGILKEHRWSPSSEKWVDEYRVALRNTNDSN